ncbi:MAG: hypothetical protein NTY53_17745, partial [Kiritimatiellaeota bacterium]|nr:hypothetical protein [Kiritimatiellota bacterium]
MKTWSIVAGLGIAWIGQAAEIFVAPEGNDNNPGTQAKPLVSLTAARDTARKLPRHNKEVITIALRGGTYYLPAPLVLTAADSGITWRAAQGETPVISGGFELTGLKWEAYKDGIFK